MQVPHPAADTTSARPKAQGVDQTTGSSSALHLQPAHRTVVPLGQAARTAKARHVPLKALHNQHSSGGGGENDEQPHAAPGS